MPTPSTRRNLLQLGLLGVAGTGLAIWLRQTAPVGRVLPDRDLVREILGDPDAPRSGPADADLTVAVFGDYRCSACRMAYPALLAAARADRGVRILYRDWPIFGGMSVQAARVALAAAGQGRYVPVHHALMTDPRPLDGAVLQDIATRAGADWPRLQAGLAANGAAIDRRLALVARQAALLGLPGTPGYLAGPLLVTGAQDESAFGRAFRQARDAAAL